MVPKRLRATRHAVTGSRYDAFDATQRLDVLRMYSSWLSIKDLTRTVELSLAVGETEPAHGLAMCGSHSKVVRVGLEMHDDSGLVGGLGPDVGASLVASELVEDQRADGDLGVVHLEARLSRFEVDPF